jgi:nitroimidazol reductase NimA-like FMN-containing flavoprotein (pyridoxamine 5'-phosphate oxidase superfamily)
VPARVAASGVGGRREIPHAGGGAPDAARPSSAGSFAACPPTRVPPAARRRAPDFRALSPDECADLLARGHVGRIAYAVRDHVRIAPIHYVYADGWLYGRTAVGEKLAALRSNPWVAFEVDEWRGRSRAERRGARRVLPARARRGARRPRALGARGPRSGSFVPAAFGPDDPTPERDVVFRVHAGEVSGRAAEPAGA